ncbi:lysoplasmalogenase family protein [Microbacterium sp.]|uniref:lysoplasmalogenase family protein n=1 Tax=Microbacterium sp. TaxID=51671 RepID=UPI0028118DAA|nr:lysoplasmalogenase family protein [Microbacterium sp.]
MRRGIRLANTLSCVPYIVVAAVHVVTLAVQSPLAAYGLVPAGTAATSARCGRLVAIGGAFFLASDSILAFRLFLPDGMPGWTSPAVILTYTIGQGLIVAGALRSLRKGGLRWLR